MRERRDAVRAALEGLMLDALLVTTPVNVRYLTGFTGSNGQLLVGAEDVLLTDSRYAEQGPREAPGCGVHLYGGGVENGIAAPAATLGVSRLGIEASHLTVLSFRALADALPGVTVVETSGVVEALRLRKDEREIDALRRAASFGDAAFEALLGELREGMSERDVAVVLEEAMRRAGADGPAFDSIVAFGESAAEPHHRAGERRLRRGDVIKLDFGARRDGYHSDMTRTIAFGRPAEEMAAIHALVRAAQQAGVDAVCEGATVGSVDDATRAVLLREGHDYGHGTGHGVGLQVHEAPAVRRGGADILAAGMVITVEPGVYLPGTGGVRIEDTVVVRPGGCEILTRSPKDLIEV